MATQHAIDEADIRARIDKLVEAVRAMDLEGVKAIYAGLRLARVNPAVAARSLGAARLRAHRRNPAPP